MRCVFFLQTSNLHPNKYIYKTIIKIQNINKNTKVKKKHFIFIIQNNNNNKKKTHKNNFKKKDKSFFKKQKHEPNIVEITHLCIRHRVQTSYINYNGVVALILYCPTSILM